MNGVKEEAACTEEKGTGHAVVQSLKEFRAAVLLCGKAEEELIAAIKDIVEGLIDKAKKGDIPSIKFLLELSQRVGKAGMISEEEIETLGLMLMREFCALQEESNGSGEVKSV